jgi:serine/threonine protein kinase
MDPYGLVGQVLDGQFRVDAPIGEGGCSVVYKGHHVGLDAPVAIKCLKLQQQLGTAFVQTFEQRFRDESKIQYRLSQGSLHIVRTLGAGTTIAPATSALVPYMVLEWLEGFTLAEQLRARHARGERGRPLAEVVRMLDPVAEAMAFAHSLGVVHRDLNPSNLFVVVLPDGTQRLKVVDFGVAKVVSENALQLAKRAATLGSLRMFTPAYGAPEQFSETFGAISPATDVYAFALLVVELLLDRPPLEGDHLADFMVKATDTVLRPTPWSLGCTTVGESVEVTMARALHVDPTRRHADIGAFWGALKHAMQQDSPRLTAPAAAPTVPVPPTTPPSVAPSTAPPGPKTRRGTLILKPEKPFADAPSNRPLSGDVGTTGSPFTESTTNGPRGTLQLPAVPSHDLASRPITVRPPDPSSVADPLGPTHQGQPQPGASPLSMTVTPGQQMISPLLQHAIDETNQRSSMPLPPPPGAPLPRPEEIVWAQPPATRSEPPLPPEAPVLPEALPSSASRPRWLLLAVGLGGLAMLAAGGWAVSRMLAP